MVGEPLGAWQGDQHQGVIIPTTQKRISFSKIHIIKECSTTYAFSPVSPYSHKEWHFQDWGKLGNGIEKNQVASFGGYTTILKQLCLWVKGHAGFSIANVFSTAFVTDPASVSNYAHKSSSIGGIVFKMEVYLRKHFAYSHEACRVNPAADASPIRKHLITFTDSNQKDMLQSLLHSKSPACKKQREV